MARTSEADVALGVLQALQVCPDDEASLDHIKRELPKWVALSAEDRVQAPGNSDQEAWEELFRAVTSDKQSSANVVRAGFAQQTSEGLRLTKAGVAHLHSKGLT